jgi:8-oxo-dGTP pyrophosphatase MutT (NUDIX family)
MAGTQAIKEVRGHAATISQLAHQLKQPSALGLIARGDRGHEQYLLQYTPNWGLLNLVGGKMNFPDDKNDFSLTLKRELEEELSLQLADYDIEPDHKEVRLHQFSQRDYVFKDYEFHIFDVTLRPEVEERLVKTAGTTDQERWNYWATSHEIEKCRTDSGYPISETTLSILKDLGKIK